MKTMILSLMSSLILFCHASGQDSSINNFPSNNKQTEIEIQNFNLADVPFKIDRINSPLKKLSAVRLNPAQNATGNFQKNSANANLNSLAGSNVYENGIGSTAAACFDTSFGKQIVKGNCITYVYYTLHTHDDGVLISGGLFDTTQAPQNAKTFAFIAKFDYKGYILWSKQFADPGVLSNMGFHTLYEMQNGNITATGNLDYSNTSTTNIVMQLSSNGNLLWSKTFNSKLNNCAATSSGIYINSIAEGLNADVLLCGNTTNCAEQYETFCRFDKNGNLVWNSNLSHSSSLIQGIGIFMENDHILVIGNAGGLTEGSDNTINLHFLTLDYNTGLVKTQKAFKTSYDNEQSFYKSFVHWYTYAVKANNGHYFVYGKLYSDYGGTIDTTYHFGITEFDSAYDFVQGYTINSQVNSTSNNDNIYVNENGKVVFTLLRNESPSANFFLGSLLKGQFLKRRKMSTEIGLSGANSTTILNDGSYVNAQSFYGVIGNNSKSYMHFKKVYDSYSANSSCFGEDSSFAFTEPLNYTNYDNLQFTSIRNDQLTEVHSNITGANIQLISYAGCTRLSRCDTVKIHAPSVICSIQPNATITAFKNIQCGAAIFWQMDTSALKNISVINDTAMHLSFSKDWEGYIYAKLQGSCGAGILDSQYIHVTVQKTILNLGADTLLCKNSTIALKAQPNFTSYEWQDGSTDSVLLADKPGTYYLSAIDACSNLQSDTINVIAAPEFNLSLGSDTIKCNNDSITLKATEGFNNYQWSPAYNISDLTGNTTKVSPTINTSYTITAEKWPGCIVKDTIHIKVFQSAPINLGADTSICSGAVIQLNAGNGFENYAWNSGDSVQQIAVAVSGFYSVTARDIHQCSSSDTILVQNFSKSPAINLGSDTSFCAGILFQLDAGTGFSSYVWNTGASTQEINVYNAGTYTVTATDANHCTSADTLIVQNIYTAAAIDLGNDTSFCRGNSIQLNAGTGFSSYVWNTGASTQQINIANAGTYTVTATDANHCTSADTLIIQNIYTAAVINLGNDTSFCYGNSIQLNAGGGFSDYVWNTGAPTQQINVTDAGVYTVTATDANHCISSDTLIVQNIYISAAINLGSDTSFCHGNSIELNAGSGFSDYVWNTGASTQQINVSEAGTYAVTATDVNHCSSSDTLIVQNIYTAAAINLGNDTSFCYGNSIQLNAGSGFSDYVWNTGASTQQIDVSNAGTYAVTATDANYCTSADTLIIHNVYPSPKIKLTNDMTLCRGTTYNIYPGNFSAYLWQDGSTANHFSATMPGTYIVTVTNEYQCSATDSLHITGIKELPVNFMPDTMTVCTGQSAILKPAGNFKDYFWSNNSTASSINVSQAGIYWLQVSNADGCVNKDSTIVTLKACNKQVVFPTGFTPNHDGLNDIFRAKVFGSLEKFHMMIYNRFGQKVFETSDLQTGWDGALNGKLQDNGTYVWICQYQFSGAANGEVQKGTITLLK